jgi:ribosomal protein S18 acetylase RimI-like enzyme
VTKPKVVVRGTRPEDFPGIIALCRTVYPESRPWNRDQLASHLATFPHGQLVAVAVPGDLVVGMAASLIVKWDDYERSGTWRDFTAHGTFSNHDARHGRTLYGAEVMVDPTRRRQRIGHRLYEARRAIARDLRLLRIRAGSRLRGYHRYATRMSAEEYVIAILEGRLKDPTLSFQLREGFRVFAVVSGYLPNDPESLGYAALIEWLNVDVATPEDFAGRDARFAVPQTPTPY